MHLYFISDVFCFYDKQRQNALTERKGSLSLKSQLQHKYPICPLLLCSFLLKYWISFSFSRFYSSEWKKCWLLSSRRNVRSSDKLLKLSYWRFTKGVCSLSLSTECLCRVLSWCLTNILNFKVKINTWEYNLFMHKIPSAGKRNRVNPESEVFYWEICELNDNNKYIILNSLILFAWF